MIPKVYNFSSQAYLLSQKTNTRSITLGHGLHSWQEMDVLYNGCKQVQSCVRIHLSSDNGCTVASFSEPVNS